MIRIACDVHTHTLFSRHAYSTLEEDVRAASAKNLELLGITDHFSCMLFDQQTLKNFQYFINMSVWPKEWMGVRLLHGCEADIVDVEGHLFGWDIPVTANITEEPRPETTLKEKCFGACDYAIASIHRADFCDNATRAQNTQMYINALQDPKILLRRADKGKEVASSLRGRRAPLRRARLHGELRLRRAHLAKDWRLREDQEAPRVRRLPRGARRVRQRGALPLASSVTGARSYRSILSSTGQWSLPKTSLWMLASATRSATSSLTRK